LIFNTIMGIYESLSSVEKKIADYILNSPDDVIHYSITEFAHVVGVSESTIYRLVRKIGFDGYQVFKIELTRDLSRTEEYIKGSEGKLSSMILEMKNSMEHLQETLKQEDLDKAVEWIIESRKVIFFGVGRSGVVADYGGLLFSLLGIPAFHYNDPHVQVIVAAGLGKKDVVISISHSGNIRDTVKSTLTAKQVGAKTIAITSGTKSPLTKVADLVLYSPATKFEKHEFLRSNLGEFALTEILFRLVLQKIASERQGLLDNVSEVLKPKKYTSDGK